MKGLTPMPRIEGLKLQRDMAQAQADPQGVLGREKGGTSHPEWGIEKWKKIEYTGLPESQVRTGGIGIRGDMRTIPKMPPGQVTMMTEDPI